MTTGQCAWTAGGLDVSDDPSRPIRIFRAGVNDSTQGPVLFDEEAAKLVMARFAARGVDGVIDLEHLSLDEESQHWDPDARGHYQLEVRRDAQGGPELWMVPRWNDDGARRIASKTQRYVSPFFEWRKTADGDRRVVAVHNVGLVADPATHGAQPLIAASRRSRRQIPGRGPASRGTSAMAAGKTNTETLTKLMEAAGLGPDAPIGELTVFLDAVLMELRGEPNETADTPPAEEMAAEVPPVEEGEKQLSTEEDKPAVMAATARLMRLADRPTFSQALDQVETWRQSHMKLAEGEAKLAAERAAMESTERRTLAVELVKLGAELPATVWANPTAAAGTQKLSARITSEPIGELRSRVAAWRAAKGTGSKDVRPPTGEAESGASALSSRELAFCQQIKLDPKVYAADKAARTKKAG